MIEGKITLPRVVETLEEAYEAGKQMSDAHNWADSAVRRGMISHALVALGALLEMISPTLPHLGPGEITDLAGGISVVIGLCLSWSSQRRHIASNPNAGLPAKHRRRRYGNVERG